MAAASRAAALLLLLDLGGVVLGATAGAAFAAGVGVTEGELLVDMVEEERGRSEGGSDRARQQAMAVDAMICPAKETRDERLKAQRGSKPS